MTSTDMAPPAAQGPAPRPPGHGEITQMMNRLDLGAAEGLRLLRSRGAPPHLLEHTRRLLVETGDLPTDLYQELVSYLPASPSQRDLAMQFMTDLINFWQRDRITIPFDPDVWAELGEVADDDLVSPDVFGFLPYANPFIVFPTPFVFPTPDPQRQHRVLGAYVFGMRHQQPEHLSALRQGQPFLCSTDDKRADSIAFRFAGFITDPDGNPLYGRAPYNPGLSVPDTVFTLCMLHFTKPVETFGALAERTKKVFANFDARTDRMMPQETTSAERAVAVMRHALAAVMYLCCSNRDLQVRAAKTVRAKKSGGRQRAPGPQAPVVVDAGFQLGAKIRGWRIEQQRSGPSAPSGQRRKPHPRRSHFHRFRYGPGRSKLSQPRFLPMIWVNAADREKLVMIKPVAGPVVASSDTPD